MNINFTPFPVLQTERLLLRKLSSEDDNNIYILRSDERVNKYIDRPRAASLEDALNFIKKTNNAIENNECIDWAITFKNESNLLGTICLWNINKEESKAEVGYELLPDSGGKGIAQEALWEVVRFGFDVLKLQTIEAFTHKDNTQSIKLLEKFSFKRDLDTESKIDRTADPNNVVYSLSKNL